MPRKTIPDWSKIRQLLAIKEKNIAQRKYYLEILTK